MKFKNISRWKTSPDMAGLLFLAQRMDEILWSFTLDTYKPPALNSPFLCQEALSIIGNIELELIDEANLVPVIEELIWSVQNDPVAKKLLDLPIENYVSPQDNLKLSDRRVKVEALSKTLGPYRYLHECLECLAESVIQCGKKDIDRLVKSVVTTLVNMGVSKQSLHLKVADFFFGTDGPAIDDPNLILDFIEKIYPYSHEYDVYFVASDLIREVGESMSAFNVRLVDVLDEDVKGLIEDSGFLPGLNECYVAVGKFRALDVYSAHAKAIRKLDQLSDLFTLFYHRKQISWNDKAIVKQCCLDKPVFSVLNDGPMDKPFDFNAKKASKELNRLLKNFAIQGANRERFGRVADLHGICVSADVVDNQLVTLWTSLETLIPSKTGSSKIVNVINGSLPFLMRPYIYRLVQRVTFDLVLWKPWLVRRILNRVPNVHESDAVHKCFALLAVKENEDLRNELYGELKDFHLLRFRIFGLHEMLVDPHKLMAVLETHERKIRWQIRRIYRTRNLLVHSGARSSYINTLVENAHEYLDQIVFEVMRLSCGEYRVSSLEQAFEVSQIKYRKMMDWLKRVDAFRPEDFFMLRIDSENIGDFGGDIAWRVGVAVE